MSPSRRTTRSHAPPPTQRSSTHIEHCKKLVRKMGLIEGLNIDHREKTWMFENIVTKLTKKLTNYQTLVWILNMTIFMRITRLIVSSTSWSGPSSGRRRDLCSSDHGKTEHEQHSRERGLYLDNKASLFGNRHFTINYGSSLTPCLLFKLQTLFS